MKNYLIPIGAILLIALGYFFFTDKETIDKNYEERLEEHRLELAYFMRTDQTSPFAENFQEFTSLKFFPVTDEYKVTARFSAIDDINKVTLPTTDGKEREYFRYGYLDFQLKGQEQRLLVYRSATPGVRELFLGFTDPSNGNGSYGGGRYLDINHSGQDQIVLDFNYGYNPYCAYNEEYSCPIPPRQNRLSVPVLAGEMNYREGTTVPGSEIE